MAALSTAANVFGVITPVKDVAEVIKAIADSVEKAKRNKIMMSTLIQTLNEQLKCLDAAISLYKHATQEQIKSLLDLKLSLKFILTELEELNQSSQNRPNDFMRAADELWNSGDISTRIERLEFDLKRYHNLFVVDSLTRIEHAADIHTSMLMSIQAQLVSNSINNWQVDRGDRLSRNRQRTLERTTIIWKSPMKVAYSNPKVMDYAYLSSKVHDLMNAVKSNSGWIEELFRNSSKCFMNSPCVIVQSPFGDPSSECEDASNVAIKLSRAIKDQNSRISVFDWFEELHNLASTLFDVGLKNEAQQIRQFEYRMLTLLTSKQGSNVDSSLSCCLYNLAASYYDEGRYAEALPLVEKVVEIERRLGAPFILNLAISLSLLSSCFRCLCQFEKAVESIRESVDLIQELALNNPLQYGGQIASCLHDDEAFLYYDLREYQKSVDCSEEAIQWLSKFSIRFKEDFPYEYVRVYWYAALAYKGLGNFGKAEEYGREATKVLNRLIHDRPLFYLQYSTSTYLSTWFREVDRSQDAVCILDESLTVYCSAAPSPAVQEKFADTLYRRAEIQHASDNFSSALDALSQVIDVRRHLLEEDDTELENLLGLLSAFRLRSSCLISLRRQSEAVKSIEMALDTMQSSLAKVELGERQIQFIFEELISQDSMLKRMDNIEAVNKLKDFKKALLCIDEAILVSRKRTLDGGCSHSDLTRLLELRFMIFMEISKFDIALLSIREVVNLYHHIVHKNGDTKSRTDFVRALSSQARCLRSMQVIEDALVSFDEVFEHIRSIWAQEQSVLLIKDIINIVNSYVTFTDFLIGKKEYLKALDSVTKSIEVIHSLNVGDINYTQALLGSLFNQRSFCCYNLRRFEEAIEDAKKGVEIHRSLVAENADNHEWNFAISLHEHARSSLAFHDLDGALRSIEEAVEIESRIALIMPDEISIRNDLKDSIEVRTEIQHRMSPAAEDQNALPKTPTTGIMRRMLRKLKRSSARMSKKLRKSN